MTTPASGRKLTSACNGVTKIFNCPVFRLPADLSVYLLNAATDPNSAGTLLVQGVDYVISGNGPAGTAQITTTAVAAYAAPKYIRRWRNTSRRQDVDIVANQGVPAETQEGALDRLSLIDEEHDDDLAQLRTDAVPVALAANSISGNNTGAPATAFALTAAQVTAMLPAVTGDAGAGGVKGLVPAPGAGDAVANKFLAADGTWKVAPSASGLTPFTGDAGAGGAQGLVPAPAAGDAAAGKFLKASGQWVAPPGGGAGTTTNLLTFNNGGAGAASGTTFDGSVARTISFNTIGAARAGSITAGDLTMNTAKLAGRTTAAAGAVQEIGVDATLSLAALVLGVTKVPNAATFQATGGVAPGTTFDGSAARVVDYSTVGAASARPTIATPNASFAAADGDNNSHKVLSGAGTPTLTLGNITAGTSFTVRATTAWAIACAGGLSKNGAAPGAVTVGAVAANSLITFLHEGAGVWVASGSGLT